VQKHEIVVDCILIGEGGDNKTARAISKSSGGYCFNPKTLPDALKLNELETMLSLYERPDAKGREPVTSYQSLLKFSDVWLFPLDVCNDETVPSRKQPEALKGAVRSLEKTLDKLSNSISIDLPDPADANRAVVAQRNRQRRIMKEISNLMKNPHPAFDIYPNRDDISFWKIVMEGPNESPYKGGTFLMYMSFPPEYPLLAPEVRFITPIRHCNVNSYGKICHSIFTRAWSGDTTIQRVLECIYGLFLNPDTEDPLDSTLALQFFDGNGQYEASIMSHVTKHASKQSRDAFRREMLLAEGDEDSAEDMDSSDRKRVPQ